jgi:hypothetical protein
LRREHRRQSLARLGDIRLHRRQIFRHLGTELHEGLCFNARQLRWRQFEGGHVNHAVLVERWLLRFVVRVGIAGSGRKCEARGRQKTQLAIHDLSPELFVAFLRRNFVQMLRLTQLDAQVVFIGNCHDETQRVDTSDPSPCPHAGGRRLEAACVIMPLFCHSLPISRRFFAKRLAGPIACRRYRACKPWLTSGNGSLNAF